MESDNPAFRHILYSTESLVITVEAMVGLIMNGMIVDGRAGGLVFGRRHSQGDVHMMQYTDGVFGCYACLEGGEYIVNKSASEAFTDRLVEINEDKSAAVDGLQISAFRNLVTMAEPHDKFLFIDAGQFVINRESTTKHIKELELINEQVNPYTQFDMDKMILCK